MPRAFSISIQSETVERRPDLPCTAPASLMTWACRASASVSVDLPASGWLMTANVRRRAASRVTSAACRASARSVAGWVSGIVTVLSSLGACAPISRSSPRSRPGTTGYRAPMTSSWVRDLFEGRATPPPAATLLGFELRAFDPEAMTIEVGFTARAEFLNTMGHVQGGMLCAMLDSTLGSAVVATLGDGRVGADDRPAHPVPLPRAARAHHRPRAGHPARSRDRLRGRRAGRQRRAGHRERRGDVGDPIGRLTRAGPASPKESPAGRGSARRAAS